jgi:Na+-driven multidrug efflux pump
MARLVNTLFLLLPTAFLLLFLDEVLITFFHQNSLVSEYAVQYAIISMPGIWAMS